MTVGASAEACFTVEGLESVEVAKLTPAKARERKVAIPGDPNREELRAVDAISSIYPRYDSNGKRTFGCCTGPQSPKSTRLPFQVDVP